MSSFGLVRGVYGSEAKYYPNIDYYKYVLKSTKEKKVQEAQGGVMHCRIREKAEQQRYLSEKEKEEIRKKVILPQDTIKGKDKTITEQQR